MDVSSILRRVTDEVLTQARSAWPDPEPDAGPEAPPRGEENETVRLPAGAVAVRFSRYGWVQNVDYDALLAVLPAGASVRLETFAGRYAVAHTPICHIFPPPEDAGDLADAVRATVMVGESRTFSRTWPTACASSLMWH